MVNHRPRKYLLETTAVPGPALSYPTEARKTWKKDSLKRTSPMARKEVAPVTRKLEKPVTRIKAGAVEGSFPDLTSVVLSQKETLLHIANDIITRKFPRAWKTPKLVLIEKPKKKNGR